MEGANGQDMWRAEIADYNGNADEFEVTMSWVHNPDKIFVAPGVTNPGDNSGDIQSGTQGKCNPGNTESNSIAPQDNIAWTMPRFFPKAVSPEITAQTGIEFVSLDWQPCGHKDILICHAESHYDFHMYYVKQDDLTGMQCGDKPALKPTCPDTYDSLANKSNDSASQAQIGANEPFYRLMKNNMIKSATRYEVDGTTGQKTQTSKQNFDFCVDPTSAMPASGIHYGDVQETLEEWKEPVTILGSYDCKLTFFEAMFSYRWVRGYTKQKFPEIQYPKWESGELEYENKDYDPLPFSWSVEADPNCDKDEDAAFNNNECVVTLKIRGKKCSGGSCPALPRNCGQQKACKSGGQIGLVEGMTEGSATYGTYNDANQPGWKTSASTDVGEASAATGAHPGTVLVMATMLVGALVRAFF
jgi:hypothetical protein